MVLMGASEGAKASLVAAAGMQPPVVGVVSLSAEAYLKGGIDVASYIAKIPCSLLLLTSTDDKYGSAPAAHSFLAAARTGQARLVTLPGAAHGTALLQPPTATDAQAAVDGFLHSAFGSAG
jgi:pimeloyl-ACP methyl ester carboxylesterase